jgi:hypothetical protein
MLKYILISFICFVSISALGQGMLKGRVFEIKTRIPLADIQVIDTTSNRNTITDDKGRFSIAAKIGDILIFKGFAYLPDTVLITDLRDHEVFLTLHSNLLSNVNVTGTETKNLNTYYDPMFHGQTVVEQRDANLNPVGGIVIRLHYWKSEEHKRERAEKEQENEQVSDQIARAFSPANVAKYVPLNGQDLTDFIVLYTPSVKVYSKNDFNLLAYISDSYQKYLKLPPDKRHPAKLGDEN